MSDNVGLSTPRGSGTSGYVQRNLAAMRPRDMAAPYPPKDYDSMHHKQRQPDKDLLEHDRKREVEVKVFELRDKLEDEGYGHPHFLLLHFPSRNTISLTTFCNAIASTKTRSIPAATSCARISWPTWSGPRGQAAQPRARRSRCTRSTRWPTQRSARASGCATPSRSARTTRRAATGGSRRSARAAGLLVTGRAVEKRLVLLLVLPFLRFLATKRETVATAEAVGTAGTAGIGTTPTEIVTTRAIGEIGVGTSAGAGAGAGAEIEMSRG